MTVPARVTTATLRSLPDLPVDRFRGERCARPDIHVRACPRHVNAPVDLSAGAEPYIPCTCMIWYEGSSVAHREPWGAAVLAAAHLDDTAARLGRIDAAVSGLRGSVIGVDWRDVTANVRVATDDLRDRTTGSSMHSTFEGLADAVSAADRAWPEEDAGPLRRTADALFDRFAAQQQLLQEIVTRWPARALVLAHGTTPDVPGDALVVMTRVGMTTALDTYGNTPSPLTARVAALTGEEMGRLIRSYGDDLFALRMPRVLAGELREHALWQCPLADPVSREQVDLALRLLASSSADMGTAADLRRALSTARAALA